MKKLTKHLNTILLGLLITSLFSMIVDPQIPAIKNSIERIEGIIFDVRLNLTLPETPRQGEHNIFIVDIDEKALKEVGRWPWSRATVKDMVLKLQDAGVVVVGFDVIFSEPEKNPVDTIVAAGGLQDASPEYIAQLRYDLDADRQMAEAIADYDVVLGALFQEDVSVDVGELKDTPLVTLDPTALRFTSMSLQGKVSNIPILQEAAMGQGFFNSAPDLDGSIRRAALVIEHKGILYPSLAVETARLYTLSDTISVETVPLPQSKNLHNIIAIKFGKRRIPTDGNGRVLVPFRGGQKSFPYYSAADILAERLDPELMEGGIALVGTSAVGIADLRETAVGLQYPGVEVHANVLEGLLQSDLFFYRPEYALGVTMAQVLVFGVLLSVFLPFLGPMTMALLGASSLAFVISFNLFMWTNQQVELPIIQPFALVIVITGYNIARGFFSEQANKQQIKSMFDQYVPPAHIDQMLNDPSATSLKGERREMSVLFSDIRSFTSISEKLSANDLKDMLNEYFSPITKSIFEHQGTIDKYVGDMVMAFWGAPIKSPTHAEDAVIGGFDMLAITERLRKEFVAKDWPEVKVGIGINTGDMNVGDMGSEYRRSYTVLGDAVNLGSRLEGLTKFYGLEFLVSEFTKAQCPNIEFRPVDKVKVKGKDEAVAIFEPVCPKDKLDEVTTQEVADLNSAYDDYLNQDWDAATEKYGALKQQFPERYLYQLYLERIETLRHEELPENWDGSFTHTSK